MTRIARDDRPVGDPGGVIQLWRFCRRMRWRDFWRRERAAWALLLLLGSKLHGLGTFAALVGFGLKGDAHSLGQILQPGLLESRDVNEDVVAATVRLDEAEPFLFIKKFDSPSLTHRLPPILLLVSAAGTVLTRRPQLRRHVLCDQSFLPCARRK
jgi:hypothetical protein